MTADTSQVPANRPAAVASETPSGFETSYLPEELEGRRYYEPSGSGEESSDENTS